MLLLPQTKDQGNTWDINDPRYLQLNPPARTTDDPADNPVSGFQVQPAYIHACQSQQSCI